MFPVIGGTQAHAEQIGKAPLCLLEVQTEAIDPVGHSRTFVHVAQSARECRARRNRLSAMGAWSRMPSAR